jgi:hypothetical protein
MPRLSAFKTMARRPHRRDRRRISVYASLAPAPQLVTLRYTGGGDATHFELQMGVMDPGISSPTFRYIAPAVPGQYGDTWCGTKANTQPWKDAVGVDVMLDGRIWVEISGAKLFPFQITFLPKWDALRGKEGQIFAGWSGSLHF